MYNCRFWPAGDGYSGGSPVQSSSGAVIGYLNQGRNYVYCRQWGGEPTSGPYYNH